MHPGPTMARLDELKSPILWCGTALPNWEVQGFPWIHGIHALKLKMDFKELTPNGTLVASRSPRLKSCPNDTLRR